MRDENAIIESLHYLLKRLGRTDKLKLVKLLFFADKYHLLKYARQISGDSYDALPAGPIPSGALDILNSVTEYGISSETIQQAKKLFKVEDNDRMLADPEMVIEYDSLSRTDIEALNFAIDNFGDKDSAFLIDYSHDFPEWYRHEHELKSGQTRCKMIKTSELLSNEDRKGKKLVADLHDDKIGIAKDILAGYC
jgi:uncharacterized phage-associated protein